jgi:hypothetical protein
LVRQVMPPLMWVIKDSNGNKNPYLDYIYIYIVPINTPSFQLPCLMISKGIALFIWKTICKKILHWNMIFSQPRKPGHDPKLTNSYLLPSVSPEKPRKRCEIGINFQNLEVSINGGSPSYGWFIMENPTHMDDLEVPPF